MFRERLRRHGWKLLVLVTSIVVSVAFDVPKPVKAAAGAVAIALAIGELVARRRRRQQAGGTGT